MDRRDSHSPRTRLGYSSAHASVVAAGHSFSGGNTIMLTPERIPFIVFTVPPIWLLADAVCSGTNSLVAQVGMRLVAGPAQADRLAFS